MGTEAHNDSEASGNSPLSAALVHEAGFPVDVFNLANGELQGRGGVYATGFIWPLNSILPYPAAQQLRSSICSERRRAAHFGGTSPFGMVESQLFGMEHQTGEFARGAGGIERVSEDRMAKAQHMHT